MTERGSCPERRPPPPSALVVDRGPDFYKGRRPVDGAWVPVPPPLPEEVAAAALPGRRALVDAERDRRLASEVTFQARRLDCGAVSKTRIGGAATLAGFAMMRGAGAGDLFWHAGVQPFAWIAADNGLVLMDAPTCFAFGQAAAHEAAHVLAGRALKDMAGGVPDDHAADAWWPA